LRESLEAHAQALNADARFVGFVAEPAGLYRLADVVALVSEMEAFPTVLLEAAAYGKPVVASRVGGIPEIVADGVTGIVVAPGNVTAVGAALERLQDAGLREGMGVAAHTAWRERFSGAQMAAALARVYDEALDR